MLSWPTSLILRAPSRDPWQAALPDGVRRTPMDQGPSKTRGDSTAIGGLEQFEAEWTPAELDDFMAFWEAAKAERFTLQHWFWGASEAQFTGAPRVRRAMKKFVVNFELEVWVNP